MPVVKQMSVAVCKIFACKICGEKALQEEDMWYLELWQERDRRRDFYTALQQWQKLGWWHPGKDRRKGVAGPAVQLALEEALEGLWIPETIVPAVLCEAKSAAAEAVLQELRKSFEHLNVPLLDPAELGTRLARLAENIVEARPDVLDGLIDWWQTWIDRAVKLLFSSGAKERLSTRR